MVPRRAASVPDGDGAVDRSAGPRVLPSRGGRAPHRRARRRSGRPRPTPLVPAHARAVASRDARVSGARRIRVARVITRLNVGGPSFQAILLTQRLDPERFETPLFARPAAAGEGESLDLRPELGPRPRPTACLR